MADTLRIAVLRGEPTTAEPAATALALAARLRPPAPDPAPPRFPGRGRARGRRPAARWTHP